MPKLTKQSPTYSLTGSWGDSESGAIYSAPQANNNDTFGYLTGWFQATTDISSAGNWVNLVSGSGHGNLHPPVATRRPAFKNSSSPASLRGNRFTPTGFCTSSYEFDILVEPLSDYLTASSHKDFSFGTNKFTISLWVYLNTVDRVRQGLVSKLNDTSLTGPHEYGLYVTSNGGVKFDIYKNGSTQTATVYVDQSLKVKTWHHIVATYDGTVGTSAAEGLELFIDGTKLVNATRGTGASFTQMTQNTAAIFAVGVYDLGNVTPDYLDGRISELAIWENRVLSDREILALSNAPFGIKKLSSGFLNNPPRILQQENDFRTGSYPSVARTGNSDFTGKGKVHFNDTKTVEYFSSYPKAEIKFLGLPADASTIGITGSNGEPKVTFEFQKGVVQSHPGSTLVDIAGSGQTASSAAFQLVKQINSSSLGMEARAIGPVVKLRNHTPGEYPPSTLITSSSRLVKGIPVKVTQFGSAHRPQDYSFPMILPVPTVKDYASGSTHINALVATPNVTGSLNSKAVMKSGVSGPGIHFTPGENLKPFDDGGFLINPDSAFYTTGTDPKVIEGFSARLSSKTAISIDVASTTQSEVYFSTGSNNGNAWDQGRTLPGKPGTTSGWQSTKITINSEWPGVLTGSSEPYVKIRRTNSGQIMTFTRASTAGSASFVWNGTESVGDVAKSLAQSIRAWSDGIFDAGVYGANNEFVRVWENNPELIGAGGNAIPECKDSMAKVSLTNTFGYIGGGTWSGAAASVKSIVDINSGLAYYNTVLKRWEAVGNLSSGSYISYTNKNLGLSTGSNLAIIPTHFFRQATSQEFNRTNRSLGEPTDFAGFPSANQFNATGSQLIDVGSYISTPLVVEKVALKIPAIFGSSPVFKASSPEQHWPSTFMLILQRENQMTGTLSVTNQIYEGPSRGIVKDTSVRSYQKDRRIVWFGRVSRFCNNSTHAEGFADVFELSNEQPRTFDGAELWIGTDNTGIPSAYGSAWGSTGSFIIENECKSFASIPRSTPALKPYYSDRTAASQAKGYPYMGRANTGRNLGEFANGRSFIRGNPGSRTQETLPGLNQVPGPAGSVERIPVYESTVSVSPFVLLPGDKLILAYANQPYFAGPSGDATTVNERADKWADYGKTSLITGSATLTLYGTEVREDKPVSFSLNQPLTSDAIHEDVRDETSPFGEGKCLDQWVVEPRTSYVGSYVDNFVTGTMLDRNDVNWTSSLFQPNIRQSFGSAVEGVGGISGSMQRFVRAHDTSEIYYDSTAPSLMSITNHWGIYRNNDLFAGYLGDTVLLCTNKFEPNREYTEPSGLVYFAGANVLSGGMRWCAAGAYEGMAGAKRFPTVAASLRESDADGTSIDTMIYVTSGVMGSIGTACSSPEGGDLNDAMAGGSGNVRLIGSASQLIWGTFNYTSPGNTDASNPWQSTSESGYELVLKTFFGIGDWYGLPYDNGIGRTPGWFDTVTKPDPDTNILRVVTGSHGLLLRGFKYGMMNCIPTSPSAVFRADHYGQFRDMLEPPKIARLYKNLRLEEPDIKISFFNRNGEAGVSPETTNSQNLSPFATSSIPYADGMSKDRPTTQPDLLDQVDIELDLKEIF